MEPNENANPEGQEDPQEAPEKTFTQADLDRILGQRLAKFADYDELKSKIVEQEDLAKTEQEKAIDQARREERANVSKEWAAKFVAVRAEALAAMEGFQNPEDASRFVQLDTEWFDATTGQVDDDAVKAALKDVVAARPYLLKPQATQPPKPRQVGLGVKGDKGASDPASVFGSMDGLSF